MLICGNMAEMSTVNPWSTQDNLLGMRLGDPQSGLTLARRHGLLDIDPTCKYQVSVCVILTFIIGLFQIIRIHPHGGVLIAS